MTDIDNPRQLEFRNNHVTPTLVKLCPEPACKIIGNLSECSKVIQALGLSGDI